MDARFFGIEIGGSKLQIVVGNSQGQIQERHRFRVAASAGGEGIRRQLKEALQTLMKQGAPEALGVGFGGPVDYRQGTICCSHQVEGWHTFELGKWLQELTGRPVTVENDSNTAALAEARLGAGRGFSPVFYFNMGSGVGGGLILDSQIYHGMKPGEVEFGHLRLDRHGPTVESRCSGWAVDARIRELNRARPDSGLARHCAEANGGEATHLAAALAERDPTALALLEELAGDLGFALSHPVHLFHPEVIVMGGGLALAGEPLRAAVARAMETHLMEVFTPGPPLRLAQLMEDAVPAGALLLAAAAAEGPRQRTPPPQTLPPATAGA